MTWYDWFYVAYMFLIVYLGRINMCMRHHDKVQDELANANITIKQWQYLREKVPSPFFMALMFTKWKYEHFFKVNL